jgi:hypothetical protein
MVYEIGEEEKLRMNYLNPDEIELLALLRKPRYQ